MPSTLGPATRFQARAAICPELDTLIVSIHSMPAGHPSVPAMRAREDELLSLYRATLTLAERKAAMRSVRAAMKATAL